MARWWKENYDASKHVNQMDGLPIEIDGGAPELPRPDDLAPCHVVFVEVARFTFTFFSLDELHECLGFYERRVHPSSRRHIGGADHWELERWFERLPAGLNNDHNRPKVVAALRSASAEFSVDPCYRPVRSS